MLALFLFTLLATTPAVSAFAQNSAPESAEQQLVTKYAPIAGLKTQSAPCDESGEPYIPAPIDVWFNDPAVTVKKAEDGGSASTDPVIVNGPTGADLYGLGSDYYLDFPGEPRDPGCDYEQWFDSRMAGHRPTTYAHIKSNGLNQLAVQYWLYYVFNDFNNKHESDWEVVQLVWDVPTVEEALKSPPVELAFAQHGGGETATWGADKVHMDGARIIVFPAAGSHASQYGNAVYLGWGENGTGFGCDTTTTPTTLVPLNVVLLPDQVPAEGDEFGWLTFKGRWGERQRGEYNGPTGPRMKSQWLSPFVWQEGLRDSSMEVPTSSTFGPGPTQVFCSLSTYGSMLFTTLGSSPVAVITFVGAITATLLTMYSIAKATLRQAWAMYRSHLGTLALIGLILIPIGMLFSGLTYLLTSVPPGEQLFNLMNEQNQAGNLVATLIAGIVQHLVGIVVVGPAIIEAFPRFERNEPAPIRAVYGEAFRKLKTTAKAVLLVTIRILPLCIIVIGIPLAIWLFVRWLFVPQAVMLDGKRGREALRMSATVTGRGHQWFRVTGIAFLLIIIGAAPGPLAGLVFLIIGSSTVLFANIISSLIYAAFLPYSILGLTILYRDLQLRRDAPASVVSPATSIEGSPVTVQGLD